jgi:hypothetical protein
MPSLNTNISATTSGIFPTTSFSQANTNNVFNSEFASITVSGTYTTLNSVQFGPKGAYLYLQVPATNPAGRMIKVIGSNPEDGDETVIASLTTGDTAFIPVDNRHYNIRVFSPYSTTTLNYFIGNRGGMYEDGIVYVYDKGNHYEYVFADMSSGISNNPVTIDLDPSVWYLQSSQQYASYNKGFLIRFTNVSTTADRFIVIDSTGDLIDSSSIPDMYYTGDETTFGTINSFPQTPNGGWLFTNNATSAAGGTSVITSDIKVNYVYDDQINTFDINPISGATSFDGITPVYELNDGTKIVGFSSSENGCTDYYLINKSFIYNFFTDEENGTVATSIIAYPNSNFFAVFYADTSNVNAPIIKAQIINSSGVVINAFDYTPAYGSFNTVYGYPISNRGFLFALFSTADINKPYIFMKWDSASNTFIGGDFSIKHIRGTLYQNIESNISYNLPSFSPIDQNLTNISKNGDIILTLYSAPITSLSILTYSASRCSFLYFPGGTWSSFVNADGITGSYFGFPHATGVTASWRGQYSVGNEQGPLPISGRVGFNVLSHPILSNGASVSTSAYSVGCYITATGGTYTVNTEIVPITSASVGEAGGSITVENITDRYRILTFLGSTTSGATLAGNRNFYVINTSNNTRVGQPLNVTPIANGPVSWQSRSGSLGILAISGTATSYGATATRSWFFNLVSPTSVTTTHPFNGNQSPSSGMGAFSQMIINGEKNIRGVNDGNILFFGPTKYVQTTGPTSTPNRSIKVKLIKSNSFNEIFITDNLQSGSVSFDWFQNSLDQQARLGRNYVLVGWRGYQDKFKSFIQDFGSGTTAILNAATTAGGTGSPLYVKAVGMRNVVLNRQSIDTATRLVSATNFPNLISRYTLDIDPNNGFWEVLMNNQYVEQ